MKTEKRRMLVTSALPYANGAIHLGHIVEQIQADIWVRFQRMRGHECYFICGDDAHGTPIMLTAQKREISPEQLVAEIHRQHVADSRDFYISFDNFYTTHSEENRQFVSTIFEKLKANGDIEVKTIEQAFDPVKELFLPDRFVKGECPRCHSKDQYGDNCEVCGAHYSPTDLINSISALSGARPIQKASEHYFFLLNRYQDMLKKWLHEGHVQEEVANKLDEWFNAGLESWDISRDAPYFGFEIPNANGKYFYVWLDAPVGYMASFQDFCNRHKQVSFNDYWQDNHDTELHHFIGKDIIYFHALFWPAMLTGAGFRTPTSIFAHGFLTINGQKMSKSRGTFINARDYLHHLDPEYLRYYLAAKLTSRIDDIDLNFDDFAQRVNSDLVGKVVNIASRCAGFISKHFDGRLSDTLDQPTLFQTFLGAEKTISEFYETREFQKAIREIMALADKANQYIDEHKPWSLIKEESQKERVQAICSMGLNLFRILAIYLKPVLPKLAEKAEAFFQSPNPWTWEDLHEPLLGQTIAPFKPMLQRVDLELAKLLLQHKEVV